MQRGGFNGKKRTARSDEETQLFLKEASMAVFDPGLGHQKKAEQTMDAVSQAVRARSGQWVASRRQQLGISVEEIVERTDISSEVLRLLEDGNANASMISEETRVRLAVVLGEETNDIERVLAYLDVALEQPGEASAVDRLMGDIRSSSEEDTPEENA